MIYIFGWIVCLPSSLRAQQSKGAVRCAECHQEQSNKQARSRHARALQLIAQTRLPELLREWPIQERSGVQFEYRRSDSGILASVRKGEDQVTAQLEWAFGAGAQAFTPVGRADHFYFEHRVSYYTAPQRPALTLGHPGKASMSANAALGLVQTPETMYRCFNCHATGAKPGPRGPDLSEMRPGVECERCHGPGRRHVIAARDGRRKGEVTKTVLNPGRFPARAVVEICAECHRLAKPEQLAIALQDPISVRFQPIGLVTSKCFQRSRTLSCLTCHDPHGDAQHEDAFYIAKCLQCHQEAGYRSAARNARCRRDARENCLPCHMQKTSPAPYLTFTDHRIRVYPTAAGQSVDFTAVETLITSQQYLQALDALQQMPASSSRRHLLASKAYDGLRDPARAVEEATKALELEPDREAHYLQLGQLRLSRYEPEQALGVFIVGERRFPESLLIRLGKGLALKELTRYEEAERVLLDCLERKPGFALAFDALAAVYIQTHRYQEALRASEQFVRANSAEYRGYYFLAAARDGLKLEPPETERLLRRAIELKPDFAASRALLGKILVDRGRARDAAPELETAVRLRPDYAPAHYYLALAYRKVGREKDARREFQIVEELNQKERERESVPSLVEQSETAPGRVP